VRDVSYSLYLFVPLVQDFPSVVNTTCSYNVTRIISLQTYLYSSYSLLKGVTFKVLPLSSYALSPVMLPLLGTFLKLLLWNSFQSHHILLDVFITLKSSSL